MKEISIFKDFNQVVGNKTFEAIAEIIRNGKFKTQIDELQELLKSGNENEYKIKKKSLLAFTPSGKFNGGRKMEFLSEYSKIIIIDIDKLENNINELKQKAINCKYTYSCFVSPSGKGLKILVKTENSVVKHREVFLQVQSFYEKLLNVEIDSSGKDITRLCFFSYDKEIYINNECEVFKSNIPMDMKNDIEKLIYEIDKHRIDITGNYEDWLKIGFAIESEFGEIGRSYFHSISRYNPDYNYEICNEQYSKCLKNNNSGITIKTLFHFAKQYGIVINTKQINRYDNVVKNSATTNIDNDKKVTSNKFYITENYLSSKYIIRYNVVSNKFEYREIGVETFVELNENNLYVKLQKENITISLNNLIALLKSDFVDKYNPFIEYFKSLPKWDGLTDHIGYLISFIKSNEQERLELHFRKWIVRTVKTAIDDKYFNKQALVFVSNKQNSGKSTFCRFLCPPKLSDYIVENIGTDKDSLIAVTENFLINLDELSTAHKNEINAFKSMFSKDKVKARLTYERRASVYIRRASFIGSTDRWEFLTDENGSVRWLCFEIENIDWEYAKKVDINLVYSHALYLLKESDFEYDITAKEIDENDIINKKFQITTPERELIQKYFEPSNSFNGNFMTATDIVEFLSKITLIKISPVQIGKELKFLGYSRVAKKINKCVLYGYFVIFLIET